MLLAIFPKVRAPGRTCSEGLSNIEQALRTEYRKPSDGPTASCNRTTIQQPLSTTAHRWRAMSLWVTLAPGQAPKWTKGCLGLTHACPNQHTISREAIATRLERLEAIAIRLEAIATRNPHTIFQIAPVPCATQWRFGWMLSVAFVAGAGSRAASGVQALAAPKWGDESESMFLVASLLLVVRLVASCS